ncbi:hypothetical protein CAEBREN_00378 [Caenorhabditis brenneri]|uniref:C-type LECtin n=1 Tax=Caenorhabditis brenneri TaxID=135651 RepID=G0MDU5_CAEBE|nr:hypothetical protein CAEBREN_00378 [Caenorhabditis brenneri]
MKNQILFFLFSLFLLGCLADSDLTCPAGFKLVNQSKCLKIFPTSLKHLEAETTCRGFGGTLVTVKNAIDNRNIVNMAANSGASYTWLGIFCFGNDTSSCYHDDGTGALTYNSFQSGYPKSGLGGCVYMPTIGKTAGQWVNGQCEVSSHAFICEVPTTFIDPLCTHNFDGYCYLPSHEFSSDTLQNTTFEEAMVICEEQGGAKLVSIHSQKENDFIKSIYKYINFPQIFIGAKVYIGFSWVDDTRWDYDYTNPVASSDGKCLKMDTSGKIENGGMWSPVDCKEANFFLCKRPMFGVSEKEINPKFKRQLTVPASTDFPDFSHCNTTLYLAPGIITSFGYPEKSVPTYCTWNLAVLGPYRLGLFFNDFSTASELNITDEYGKVLSNPMGNLSPFQVLAPTNIVSMSYNSKMDAPDGYHGFSVTILPF